MMSPLSSSQRWQIALLTAGAVVLYLVFRWLPTGTNLSHMDFRVSGGNSIEFCDPANPQFIPVVSVRSPVAMAVDTLQPVVSGHEARVTLRLITSSGKPLSAKDMVVAHTRKLHLLVVDPSLQDYQHIHPIPTTEPGQWSFPFTPKAGGLYRVFADFTPVATGRGLYSHADLPVEGKELSSDPPPRISPWGEAQLDGYRYALSPTNGPLRSGSPADLKFSVTRADGQPFRLEPVMDAFAHLVAFDAARGGFAHLHPAETDLSKAPDTLQPTLSFKITIPRAGRYVIWAQVAIEGVERFVSFWFDVS